MSPYRSPADQTLETGAPPAAARCPDLDLAPVLVAFWLVSGARVVFAVVRHDPFGLEVSLATMALVLTPLLMVDAAVWCLGRVRQFVGWRTT